MSGNDIAVVAMVGRFPGAASVPELWRALCAGQELITRFSRDELLAAGVPASDLDHPHYVPARGTVAGADLFDAEFFGYSPREAELIDPQQRLFLECAWEAAEEAGHVLGQHPGRVGVFAAGPASTYPGLSSVDDPLLVQTGNDVDFTAARVSYKLNLRGPSLAVSSACSSSLVAVHLAAQSLLTGEVDLALAGGVSVRFPQVRGYRWKPGSILSPDGHCRPFGAGAAGTVEANGVAVVLLKPLDRALANGDPIHAVLKGSAVDNDAADRVGFTAPGVRGQSAVIRDALTFADVDPATVGYVEAHGTATALGDPIEMRALASVYGVPGRSDPCAVGSLKSNVGHLNHAAGVAGLIKAALCLRERRLVPSLHATTRHPDLDLAGGALRVQTEVTDWAAAGVRRAAVSSFGMGGTNAHLILEEPPRGAADPGPAHDRPEVLVLSARTGAALADARTRLGGWLRERPDAPLDAVARTLQCGRMQFRHRAVVTAHRAADAADILLAGDDGVRTAQADGVDRPVAFLFPGQGAQYPGMGRDLYERSALFRARLDECAELLRAHLDGVDLRRAVFQPGPATDLDQTWLTQPALFAVEYALARLWLDRGVEPAAMLGHSVGGYVAACLAGVFPLSAALALVAVRGRLLQRVPAGAMLAVGAGEAEISHLLRGYRTVELSAVNAPGQCAVGGAAEEVEALHRELSSAAVPATRLRVTRAFHTAAVEPVMAEFAAALDRIEFTPPTRPFVDDRTGDWAAADEVTTPGYWLRHLREPVRFGAGIATLRRDLDPVFLEVGPGRTGVALAAAQGARDTVPGLVAGTPADPGQVLGSLWLAGARVDWARGWSGPRPGRVVLPTYPFQRRRHWWGGAPSGQRPPVDEWFYQPTWREQPRRAGDVGAALRATERRWVLLADPTGIAEELAGLLAAAGRDVVTVAAPDPAGYGRLARDVAGYGEAVRVVHLRGVQPADPGPGDGVTRAGAAFADLALLVRSLAGAGVLGRVRLSVVTGPARPLPGGEPVNLVAAALTGAATVVPQEYPELVCDRVELDGTDTGALARELAGGTGEPVALHGGRRFVHRAAPLDLTGVPLPPARLRPEGLYVVTGGLGRIGLALAGYLARRCRARLVLVGRRTVPARSQWPAVEGDPGAPMAAVVRRLREIEEAGGAVLPACADVADAGAVASVLAHARQVFGRPVHGVVHAAGVTGTDDFVVLARSEVADAEPHLRAKLGGVQALTAALHGENPDFVLALSSLAAVLGGLGFGAYAAANAGLDAAVRLANRDRPGTWSVVNLDGWQDPDGGHGSAFHRTRDGSALIRPEDADELFDRLFRLLDFEQTYVSVTDLRDRLRRSARPTAAGTATGSVAADPVPGPATGPRHPRPEVPTRYRQPTDELEEAVVHIWQDLLGVEPIGVDDDFFELGGHSLLAMQLVTRLRSGFDLDVPLRTVFQASTVAALSAQMATLFDGEGAP